MIAFLKHIFTQDDNQTFSMTKLLGFIAGLVMVCNFIRTVSVDWSGFGTGIGLIMAALAGKQWVEKK